MTSTIKFMRRAAIVAAVVSVLLPLAACNRNAQNADNAAGKTKDGKIAAPTQPLLLAREDLVTVSSNALASGPSITGSVQPERRADLRAEVSAVVLQVYKENGDAVKRGDLLVRLDDTAIRDALSSAQASTRAATQAHEQAERQYQRMVKLREGNIVTAEQLEDVEIRRNSALSEREASRSREVTARQQLGRTQVRAPFDGVVSDRKVSGGDTAQIGKELLKVIDPRSLRFEGFVSADAVSAVQPGQRVTFNVHGFADREFVGTIARVNPAANTTTRQVEVLVGFADAKEQPNIAGLYAEGRVETRRTNALTLPQTAIVRDGDRAYAWRVANRVASKIAVAIGDRDARTGQFPVKSGLAEGDLVLKYPSTTLREGQAVELAPPAAGRVAEGVAPAGATVAE